MLFPESDHGVGEKQNEMMPKSGQCWAATDRITAASGPGIGPQKSEKKFQDLVGLPLGYLVRSILCKPLLRLGLGQAVPAMRPIASRPPPEAGFVDLFSNRLRSRVGNWEPGADPRELPWSKFLPPLLCARFGIRAMGVLLANVRSQRPPWLGADTRLEANVASPSVRARGLEKL